MWEPSLGAGPQGPLPLQNELFYWLSLPTKTLSSMKVGFPSRSASKESVCNAGDPGSIAGLGRSPGERIGYPLPYSWASLVAQLVKICLQCERPGFDPWVGKIPWRTERLPTPVFWPREFHGLYSPWGHRELVTTERLSLAASLRAENELTLNILRDFCLFVSKNNQQIFFYTSVVSYSPT